MINKKYKNLQLYGHEFIKESYWKINENSNDVNKDIDTLRSEVENISDNTYDKDDVYTKAEVNAKIEEVVGSAPEALDTLKEISEALGNDENFAATMTQGLAKKVDKVDGKGLSKNDFTDDYKSKVDNNVLQIQNINNDLPGQLNSKVDKVDGKGLSENDFTDEYRSRINDNSSEIVHINNTFGEQLNSKVDKVDGKGLSENDFTDEYKLKLDNLNGSEGGGDIDLSNYYNKEESDGLLNLKVDKVNGKGLSTNDFDDEQKARLNYIQALSNGTLFQTEDGDTFIKLRPEEIEIHSGGIAVIGSDDTAMISAPNLKFKNPQTGAHTIITVENMSQLNSNLVTEVYMSENYYTNDYIDNYILKFQQTESLQISGESIFELNIDTVERNIVTLGVASGYNQSELHLKKAFENGIEPYNFAREIIVVVYNTKEIPVEIKLQSNFNLVGEVDLTVKAQKYNKYLFSTCNNGVSWELYGIGGDLTI